MKAVRITESGNSETLGLCSVKNAAPDSPGIAYSQLQRENYLSVGLETASLTYGIRNSIIGRFKFLLGLVCLSV